MTSDSPSVQRPADSPTSALLTLRQRRRRVWRSILLIGVTTLVLVGLSVQNRDEVAIRACFKRMEVASQILQDRYDRGLPFPSRLPMPDDPENSKQRRDYILRLRSHAYYNVLHNPGRAGGIDGVCCCRWPHTRLVGASGRHVVLFNAETHQYEVRWMNESEFAARAAAYGLDEALDP
jgi:hypothetical protein